RWHDDERSPLDLNGRGSVLDQLHQLILEDDLPGCGGYVLTETKDLLIGHTDCKLSSAALEVVQQIRQASKKVLTARLEVVCNTSGLVARKFEGAKASTN